MSTFLTRSRLGVQFALDSVSSLFWDTQLTANSYQPKLDLVKKVDISSL